MPASCDDPRDGQRRLERFRGAADEIRVACAIRYLHDVENRLFTLDA